MRSSSSSPERGAGPHQQSAPSRESGAALLHPIKPSHGRAGDVAAHRNRPPDAARTTHESLT